MKKTGTKLLSILISGLLLLSTFPMAALAQDSAKAAPQQRLLGDVNGDGTVDIGDVQMVGRYSVSLQELTDEQLRYADVNQDGEVNVGDVQLIGRYNIGYMDEIGTVTVTLSESTKTLTVGKTHALSAVLSNNPSHDRTVRWESDQPSVASVDKNGTVTAKASGRATITATLFNGQKDSCVVTVSKERYNGIDVAKYQGDIDWHKVKASGVDFAMVRSSFGTYDSRDDQRDPYFGVNLTSAAAVGLDVGAYHYSYFKDVPTAIKEADYFLSVLEPYRNYITYPVALDIEDKSQKTVQKNQLTQAARAFCDRVKAAGYHVMLYTDSNFIKNYLDYSQLSDYDVWLAEWNPSPSFAFHDIWQYTDNGSVNGISARVDLDYGYKDYHSLLKDMGLPSNNGYKPVYHIKNKGRSKNSSKLTAYTGQGTNTGAKFTIAPGEVFEFFGKYENDLTKNPWCMIRNSKNQIGWVRWNDVERF